METREQTLDRAARERLAGLVRRGIEAAVRREGGPTSQEIAEARRECPVLAVPMGAFVTIYVEHNLRGCLGEVEPEDALIEVALRCARRVPLHDYRFDPVRPQELERLTFKISVLTPAIEVKALEEVRLGVHGLLARHEGHTGLLLPEVPVEYGWDLKTFLTHLWRKAGIDARVPREEVQLMRFTSQLIGSRGEEIRTRGD